MCSCSTFSNKPFTERCYDRKKDDDDYDDDHDNDDDDDEIVGLHSTVHVRRKRGAPLDTLRIGLTHNWAREQLL